MAKLRQLSSFGYRGGKLENPRKSDPFYIIYNHRRILRARALKKLKKEKHREEIRVSEAEREAEKEENMKEWNKSMLREDSIWDHAWEVVKKQAKQQDSTITRNSQFEHNVQKLRLYFIYNFPVTEKFSLFQDKFTGFGDECWVSENYEVYP